LAGTVLSVEDGFGRDAQGGAGDRDRPTLAPPTELQVTAATATTITVIWKAPADQPRVEGYRLYLDDKADSEPVAKTTETEYTFKDLTCGTAYTLGVEAFGAGRRSERVPILSATAACPDKEAPSTPGGLAQAENSETSVRVSWTAATDGVGVVGYSVYLGGLVVASTAELSYTFAGLECGKNYTMGVAASDAAGNHSSQATLVITTKACSRRGPVPAPTNLRQTDQAETSVGLSWSGSNRAVRYNVYRDGGRAGSTRDTSYTVSGLTCGSSYTVGVEAEDAAGERSDPSKVLVTTSRCSQPPPAPGRDNQAPSTPGGLQVTGVTETTASLSWIKSSDNVAVTGYAVSADGVQVASLTETAYTFSGLVCGTTYKLGVAAYDAAGHRSEQVFAVVTTPECRPAGAPSDPAATPPPSDSGSGAEGSSAAAADNQAPTTPRRLRLRQATPDRLSVAWRPSTDDVGVQGYVLYLNGAEAGQSAERRHTFNELSCQTQYMVSVAAYDSAGNRSRAISRPFTTSACVDRPTPDTEPPTTPGELAMTGATQTTASISWTAATDNVGVAGYGVFLNGDSVGTTTETSFTVDGLTCGTSYPVAVQSYDAAGNRSGSATAVVSAEPCADTEPPSTPTDLNVSNRTRTSITVRWTASSDNVGVAGYRLHLNGAEAETTSETTHIFSELACGTSYTIGIDSFDGAGNHSGLATVAATTSACTDTTPPTPPTNLRRTAATETTISLAWNASTDTVGVTGYGIYRSGTLVGTTTTSTTYTVTGLACGTTYPFAVDARDAAGNRSSQAPINAATAACTPLGGILHVAAGGSDLGLCTAATPCASLDRAYRVATPGQTIEVGDGSYPSQLIRADSAKGSSEDVVLRANGNATVNGELNVRASHITLEGFRVTGDVKAVAEREAGHSQSDVTFRNIDGAALQIDSATGINVFGGDYGPANHNSGVRKNGPTMPGGIVIDGAVFHNHQCGGCHIEAIIVGAVNGLTIRNSRFYNNEIYNIFFETFNGSISNVTLENNWFAGSRGPDGVRLWPHSVRFARGSSFSSVLVRYNSFNGSAFAVGGNASNFRVVGNVGRLDPGDPPGGCGGPSFAYNVWQNGSCASSDRNLNGAPLPYVNASNGGDFDYHLTGGVAVDLVPGSSGDQQLGSDIDGQGRPSGGGYDAGSDER
jgi:chitodextrinase